MPTRSIAGQLDDEPTLSTTLAELFSHWEKHFAELVTRARTHGNVRPDIDPRHAGRMLLAAVEGGTMLAHIHRQPTALERSLDAAIALLTTENTPTTQ